MEKPGDHIRRVVVFDRALSDEEMRRITSGLPLDPWWKRYAKAFWSGVVEGISGRLSMLSYGVVAGILLERYIFPLWRSAP